MQKPTDGVPVNRGRVRLYPDTDVFVNRVKDGKLKKFRVRGKGTRAAITAEKLREQIRKAELQKKALQLRASGVSYVVIGKHLNISTDVAKYNVQKALESLMLEPGEDLVRLELHRLDIMHSLVWADLMKSVDVDERLRIIPTILNIMDRRAKILGVKSVLDGTSATAQVNAQINILDNSNQPGKVLIIQGAAPEYIKALEEASGHKAPDLNFKDVVYNEASEDVIVEGEVVTEGE
jgi:orotate phosphoribosyltransferase-like protein